MFADGRRLRWWWELATKRAVFAAIVLFGIAAAGTIVVQVRPVAISGAAELESLFVKRPPDELYRLDATLPMTRPAAPRTALVSAEIDDAEAAPPKAPQRPTAVTRTPAPTKPASSVAKTTTNTMAKSTAVFAPPPAAPPATPPAPPLAATAAPGWLVVSSRPWGSLYVNGRAVGTTPQSTVWLPPGAHKVEIRREGFEPYVASVTIDSNREFRLTRVTLKPVRR